MSKRTRGEDDGEHKPSKHQLEQRAKDCVNEVCAGHAVVAEQPLSTMVRHNGRNVIIETDAANGRVIGMAARLVKQRLPTQYHEGHLTYHPATCQWIGHVRHYLLWHTLCARLFEETQVPMPIKFSNSDGTQRRATLRR